MLLAGIVVSALAGGAFLADHSGRPSLGRNAGSGDKPQATIHRWSPADGKVPLRLSRHRPIVGQTITFTGRLTTLVARPVVLESGGPDWTTVTTGETDSSGSFTMTARAPSSPTTYRVRAPRFTDSQDGGPSAIYSWQPTRKRNVTPVTQTASLTFAPAPVGQSAAGVAALTPATARFTPTRGGRTAALQRRAGASWRTVATTTQDNQGIATFNVKINASAGPAVHRVVAMPHEGAPARISRRAEVTTPPLAWQDEFDGNGLDTSVWEYRQLGIRSEESGRPCAESSTDTVTVARGVARFLVREIRPPQDRAACPHGEYLNTNIGTRPSFSFQFGVMAARIKFPRQQGQHGALWSQPAAAKGIGGPAAGAEIDAVEYFGDDFRKGALQHSVYWTTPDGQPRMVGGAKNYNHLLSLGKTWSNSFHVYSVEWTPDEYIFRIDGQETFRTTRGVSNTPQYVILSLLTSDWELDKIDATKLNPMQVDWVRVWQP